MISGRSSDTTYEQTEKWKPGNTSSVTAAPPTHVPPLEHEHLAAGARQVGGSGQAVVAAADDDRVVAHQFNGSVARGGPCARSAPSQARGARLAAP